MTPEAHIFEQQYKANRKPADDYGVVDLSEESVQGKPPAQVGGTHYDTPIQPIEYIEANDMDFHEANVVKYISRWKNKNGLEDLAKCKWYLDRLISNNKGN